MVSDCPSRTRGRLVAQKRDKGECLGSDRCDDSAFPFHRGPLLGEGSTPVHACFFVLLTRALDSGVGNFGLLVVSADGSCPLVSGVLLCVAV